MDDAKTKLTGSAFQILVAATGKVQLPILDSIKNGISRTPRYCSLTSVTYWLLIYYVLYYVIPQTVYEQHNESNAYIHDNNFIWTVGTQCSVKLFSCALEMLSVTCLHTYLLTCVR